MPSLQGCGVKGARLRIEGQRFRVYTLWFGIWSLGSMRFGVEGSGSRVWGLGFGVWGLGFEV